MWSRVNSDGNAEAEAPARRLQPLRALRRFVGTVIGLALILYVSALAASRTAGFRGLVAARLGEWLGDKVEVGATALTPRLALRLDRIVWGRPDTPGAASLRVDRLRIEPDWPWRPSRLRAVIARGVSVAFAESAEVGWQPAWLARRAAEFESWLGDDFMRFCSGAAPAAPPAPVAADTVPKSSATPRRLRLEMSEAEAAWWNAAGERMAHLEGLRLEVTPVSLPGRELLHVRVAADRVERARGICAERIRVEFLDTGRQRLLLDFDTGLAPQN